MQAIQNLGLAVIASAAGIITDKKGYLVLEVFFCVWLCGTCAHYQSSLVVALLPGGLDVRVLDSTRLLFQCL